ncbi:unnamed protein product [Sphagnum troendelagicum]|uniref:DNA 3'-5' helicase n=1 Tax=Sphagnum troendelagicum TaxID=128251 RepID=A0ABP0UD61_9BRYO
MARGDKGADGSGGSRLSELQQARITENYRAAKAILARKKRQLLPSSQVEEENCSPIKRRSPLAELQCNRFRPSDCSEFEASGTCKAAASCDRGVEKEASENSSTAGKNICRLPTDGDNSLQSCSTERLCEEFDEELIQELDALCEKRSKGPHDGRKLSTGQELHSLSTHVSTVCWRGDLQERMLASSASPVLVQGVLVTRAGSPSPPTEMPEYLRTLNATQREAALSDTSKPLLILAGPGSGKTSTMVARLVSFLMEGMEARNILAMTFTAAAATEMRDRVGAAVGKAVSKELSISTFHAFCLQLCRLHAEKLGRTAEFLVYGHSQQRRAVIEATRLASMETDTAQAGSSVTTPLGISTTDTKPQVQANVQNLVACKDKAKKWLQFVTQAKAAGRTAEEYEKMGNRIGGAVLRHYEATLLACNALDYHDFINFSVRLLKEHPEVLAECQKTWTCVLVDEFQDTSTMQYNFLHLLASHNRITVVGDDDQSIFSFNGADSSGFDSFRKDFPQLKEVRLHQNYRSTRCIVEAATSLIKHNTKRCQEKQVHTDNSAGDRIVVMECRTEAAQCANVVDCILMNAVANTPQKPTYGNTAVLYRRQVTGRLFQSAFRARKIPFNVHGVAFYRKKVIKNVTAMLWTVLPGNTDIYWRRVFKALYAGDPSEGKRVVEYVDKVVKTNACTFQQAAQTVFTAKVSGTFSRRQLALGRRVLTSINMVHRLAHKEKSLSGLITAVVNLLPQRPVFNTRAVVDENGGKLLNEDDDPRTVLEYFLDDVNDFLSNIFKPFSYDETDKPLSENGHHLGVGDGCLPVLKAFLDHLVTREQDNFRNRQKENKNSVMLTTMHQSKGLEWETVFIVKANETETPLLNEAMGYVDEGASSIEEERRLFYVAMTRAQKSLYICYVVVDSRRQVLQPSRFIKEIPHHLLNFQYGTSHGDPFPKQVNINTSKEILVSSSSNYQQGLKTDCDLQLLCEDGENDSPDGGNELFPGRTDSPTAHEDAAVGHTFLKGFNIEARSTIAALFHSWARKPAFQDPKRLLSKVGFAIDERLRSKNIKNKDMLIALKCSLKDDAALAYAHNAIKWGQLPPEERALLQAERQEHFQQQGSERSMGCATATPKQIAFLHSLGCTVNPTSRLHASQLIEQYKKL